MRNYALTGAPNARDLGGLKTADGRVIRRGRLIRSGALGDLTDADIAVLQAVPLRTVVDFRTAQEISERPNLELPGVRQIRCPILPELTGVTRELGDDGVPKYFRMAMDIGNDAENWMAGLYLPLVESDYSREHYRTFLRLVLEHGEGALLYHCTVGKDRAGVGTMLILAALGVPPETIMEDYLLTNEYTRDHREAVCAEARAYTDDPAAQFALQAFESVRESYLMSAVNAIRRGFGGMDAYLTEALDFGPAERDALREKYLESSEHNA